MTLSFAVADTDAMLALGGKIATAAGPGLKIYLHGALGAGKTTFVRGYLRALGVTGIVKSPTYTLVEPYAVTGERMVYHFDLYRLEAPEALEDFGFRDYLDANSDCLIEWPEQAAGYLLAADLDVIIEMAASGRQVSLQGNTDAANKLLKKLDI
ncbi:MAG: tRNA (adenosine(37)-N6)-threonylcarbamoyltransferase complex ATPase subunit type 1 TsaE [Gammaproteobacteria bacterium]